MHVTCPAHLNLLVFISLIHSEVYKSCRSSLCNPEPAGSSPHLQTNPIPVRSILIEFSLQRLGLVSGFSIEVFQTKFCGYFSSPLATCSTRLVLLYITIITNYSSLLMFPFIRASFTVYSFYFWNQIHVPLGRFSVSFRFRLRRV